MRAETHFVRSCDGPVLADPDVGTLVCGCGQILIEHYDPARFLALGVQCGRRSELTVTPGLTESTFPRSPW